MYNCKAGGCGKPYGQHDYDVVDKVYGNGILISGTSILVLSCSCEANAGCGIKLDGLISGCLISTSYFEQNLYYNVYVSSEGYKTNIILLPHYAAFDEKSTKENNVYIDYSDTACKFKNIINYTTNKAPLQELKIFNSIENVNLKLMLDYFKLNKIPSVLEYSIKDDFPYNFIIALGINIDGNPHLMYMPQEILEVESIDGDTVTLNKQVSHDTTKIFIVSSSSAAYRFGKNVLKKYPLLIQNSYDSTVDVAYPIQLNTGDNSFILTENIKKYHPNLKVGDIIYTAGGYISIATIKPTQKDDKIFLYNKDYCNAPSSISNNLCTVLLQSPSNPEDMLFSKVINSYFDVDEAREYFNKIDYPTKITPTIVPGPTGNISNLENNTYFDRIYAASNYVQDRLVSVSNNKYVVNIGSSGYGLALCVDCSQMGNIAAFYKSSEKCDLKYAFYDLDGNYLSVSYNVNSIIPENAKYAVVVIIPSVINTDVSIYDIVITTIQ